LTATAEHVGVRSIALPARENLPAQVAHVVPVCRAAADIFSSVDAILLMTPVLKERLPSADLLHGLFDLTPAEAEVSRRLLDGRTIGEIAKVRGLSIETLRAQLKSIFMKTGTDRQSALVGLLSGLRPPG
jgi:DNA-binding CsgD family transcriptional regulator